MKLPQGIQYRTLSECVNIPALHREQGKLYESLQVSTTSFDETFGKMIETVSADHRHTSENL